MNVDPVEEPHGRNKNICKKSSTLKIRFSIEESIFISYEHGDSKKFQFTSEE